MLFRSKFSANGFQSIEICASTKSAKNCGTGSSIYGLEVKPSSADKEINFQATLKSTISGRQPYLISKSIKIEVAPSMQYPSLKCSSDPCKLSDIANKNKPSKNVLQVKPAESGGQNGSVYLVDFSILKDNVQSRGDGNFKFVFTNQDGKKFKLNDANASFSVNDKVNLEIGTSIGGKSEVIGTIKYVSISDEKQIERQLKFTFIVGEKKSPLVWVLLGLSYLVTLGIPYLFLLFSARRRAFLEVPDNEFAYVSVPFKINSLGKMVTIGNSGDESTIIPPPHRSLTRQAIKAKSRTVEIGPAKVEVTPPKWNPFKDPVTVVKIPNHHLQTTFGDNSFSENVTRFSRLLVDEAIIYFASEENLAPVTQTQIEDTEPVNKAELFSSTYESKISEELAKRSGDLSGNILFIVPFLCNKKKALAKLTSRVIENCEAQRLKSDIESLRENYLKNETEKAEKAKEKSNLPKSQEKTGLSKKDKTDDLSESGDSKSIFDDVQTEKSIWDDGGTDEDSQGSDDSRKLWD